MMRKFLSWYKALRPGVQRGWKIFCVVSALITVGFTGYQIYETLWKELKVSFQALSTPIHLGDNVRASLGGDHSFRPAPSECTETYPENLMLICLDTQQGRFIRVGSVTSPAIKHLTETIVPVIKATNIDAWRHIRAVTPSELTEDEKTRAIFFDGGPKVWRKNAGNYYSAHAAVMVAIQFSLFDKASTAGIDIGDADTVRLIFKVEGFTGGRRSDQIDQLHVFLDNDVERVRFPSEDTRDTRILEFLYNVNLEKVRAGRPVVFGLFVLPWQEKGPRTPENSGYDPRGPAHFQDFDIRRIYVDLVID